MSGENKNKGKKKLVSRREFLIGSGVVIAAGALSSCVPEAVTSTITQTETQTAVSTKSLTATKTETTTPLTTTSPAATIAPVAAPNAGTTRNIIKELPLPGQRKVGTTDFTCDVLVIGAGYAGTMAALGAQALGQKVIVVCKQKIGKSGLSPWANTMLFFDPTLGDNEDSWIQGFQDNTEYLIDLDYLKLFMRDSLARFKDWRQLGIINQNYSLPNPSQLIQYSQGNIEDAQDRRWLWPKIFKDKGIQTVERVMLTNLLTNSQGAVVGAGGFHVESDEVMIFRAKAVVICTGAGGFKSGGFPINGSTFDGDCMAYNVGAKIGGMEWQDFHGTGGTYPSDSWKQGDQRFIGRIYATTPPRYSGSGRQNRDSSEIVRIHANGPGGAPSGGPPSGGLPPGGAPPGGAPQGGRSSGGPPSGGAGQGGPPQGGAPGGGPGQGTYPPDHLANVYSYIYKPVDQNDWKNVRYDSDDYHPPITWPEIPSRTNPQPPDMLSVGGGGTGLGVHCTEGIFPADTNCWSGVEGLWAAGDALCSRLCGASYVGKGVSSSSAGVFGYVAGQQAANYAKGTSASGVSADQVKSVQNEILMPRNRKTGYSPYWIQELVLQAYAPYYIAKMKNKARLQGVLENCTFIRDNLVPKLMASDPHTNRLAHEARHIVMGLEMKLRAALIREESRGMHYREDFPYRDDKNWLAWTNLQKDSKGNMVASKVPVPDRMKTNSSMTYKQRYSIVYAGEEEAIKTLGLG